MITIASAVVLLGGLNQIPPSVDGARIEAAVLPGVGQVWLELRPFEVLSSQFVLSMEGGSEDLAQKQCEGAAREVRAWSGGVVGEIESRAYVASSPRGRLGVIEAFGRRFALAPDQGSWAGPIKGPSRWVESPGAGAPLLDEVCRTLSLDDAGNEGGAAGINHAHFVRGMRVLVAADCDYEFTSIFESAEDASAYVVSLYGAISSIYEREMQVRVQLSYLRLWTTPDDPFNAPDPLSPFRDLWNETQQDVVRDVAQLLTGRRNLPYGGVAWLNAACTTFGYSVNGYLIGSFADPGRTNPGNWDIIVCAHELGHNIGTLHTHDYGIDTCASGTVLRGGFMSYCHIVSGATSNIDLTLHTTLRQEIAEFLAGTECIGRDCDGDGVEDTVAILDGRVADANGDGVPDVCQDCDGNGTLDPQEIADGASDLDEDGVPDACQPDCNGSGLVDVLDIQNETSLDLWGNGVPDECEVDCNRNGVSDYNEILSNMALDVDRDGRLDACQDCDGEGTLDAAVLAGSRHWWVASSGDAFVRELHPRSGVRIRTSDAAPAAVNDLALGADGLIYGSFGSSVGRWSPATAAFLGAFISGGAGGTNLLEAQGLLFLPDGSLLVASQGNGAVLHYASNGSPIGVFAQLPGIPRPRCFGLALRSDGVVAVSADDGFVRGFQWPGGAPVGVLANLNPVGPSSMPSAVLYLPNGDLLVASRGLNSVHRFDGLTGLYKGRFDVGPNPSSSIALKKPMSMRLIAADSVVLITSNTNGAPIVGFDVESGYHLRTYRVYPLDAPAATGLLVMPASTLDCNGNFLPDSCDIADGWSSDGNGDGVPDECQGGPWAPADLNLDGMVDGADLGMLLANWGGIGLGDLNGDGVIDGADLGILLAAWTG